MKWQTHEPRQIVAQALSLPSITLNQLDNSVRTPCQVSMIDEKGTPLSHMFRPKRSTRSIIWPSDEHHLRLPMRPNSRISFATSPKIPYAIPLVSAAGTFLLARTSTCSLQPTYPYWINRCLPSHTVQSRRRRHRKFYGRLVGAHVLIL